jgi:hypothetical protein
MTTVLPQCTGVTCWPWQRTVFRGANIGKRHCQAAPGCWCSKQESRETLPTGKRGCYRATAGTTEAASAQLPGRHHRQLPAHRCLFASYQLYSDGMRACEDARLRGYVALHCQYYSCGYDKKATTSGEEVSFRMETSAFSCTAQLMVAGRCATLGAQYKAGHQ